MYVHFVRSGGFAGLHMEAQVNSESLSENDVQELRTEIERASFFSLPERLSNDSGGADRFQYEITVERGSQRHTIVADESALPEGLQPLVQHLELLARSNRAR